MRAFSVMAPLLWNNLIEDIRTVNSLNIFKTKLKTFHLKRAYQLDQLNIFYVTSYLYFYLLVAIIVKRCWFSRRNGAEEIKIIIIIII